MYLQSTEIYISAQMAAVSGKYITRLCPFYRNYTIFFALSCISYILRLWHTERCELVQGFGNILGQKGRTLMISL